LHEMLPSWTRGEGDCMFSMHRRKHHGSSYGTSGTSFCSI
jgi:hypothetical protein